MERELLDTGGEDCWRPRTSQIAGLNVSGLKEVACFEISSGILSAQNRDDQTFAQRSRENSMTACVQSTAESRERDVQSAHDILSILADGPPEFAWPYPAANRGRTDKRHPTSERPDRCHAALPNRSGIADGADEIARTALTYPK